MTITTDQTVRRTSLAVEVSRSVSFEKGTDSSVTIGLTDAALGLFFTRETNPRFAAVDVIAVLKFCNVRTPSNNKVSPGGKLWTVYYATSYNVEGKFNRDEHYDLIAALCILLRQRVEEACRSALSTE